MAEHASSRDLLLHLSMSPAGTCAIEDLSDAPEGRSSLVRDLRLEGHPLPVILVAGECSVPDAVRAIQEGAIDFLVQPLETPMLLNSVWRAAILTRILGLPTAVPAGLAGMIEALTPRERDVLGLLVHGLPTKTIGARLGISPRTAEIHRRRILLKMQADNVVQLTRLMILAGYGLTAPALPTAFTNPAFPAQTTDGPCRAAAAVARTDVPVAERQTSDDRGPDDSGERPG